MAKVNSSDLTIDGCECRLELSHYSVDGEDYLSLNEACYGWVSYNPNMYDTIYLFDVLPDQQVYTNWIINDSPWACIFETKSAAEGYRSGFKVTGDVEEPDEYCSVEDFILDGLRMLRICNEFKKDLEDVLEKHSDLPPLQCWFRSIVKSFTNRKDKGTHGLSGYYWGGHRPSIEAKKILMKEINKCAD